MQSGATIQICDHAVYSLHAGFDHEMYGLKKPYLRYDDQRIELDGYESVYDMAISHERLAVLFEGCGRDELCFLHGTIQEYAVHTINVSRSRPLRVGVSERDFFIAYADGALHRFGHGCLLQSTQDFYCMADQIIACTSEELVCIDADTFHTTKHNLDLAQISCIAPDPIEPGILLVAESEIYHLSAGKLRKLYDAPAGRPCKIRRCQNNYFISMLGNDRYLRLFCIGPQGQMEMSEFDVIPGTNAVVAPEICNMPLILMSMKIRF